MWLILIKYNKSQKSTNKILIVTAKAFESAVRCTRERNVTNGYPIPTTAERVT